MSTCAFRFAFLHLCVCLHLYVSVGKEQVHDDVLREDLRVVNSEFDARQLLGQLLSLVLLPGFPDVVKQGVLEGGTAKTDALQR